MKFLEILIIGKAYAKDLIPCSDGTMADPSIGCTEPIPSGIINPASDLLEILFRFAGGLMLLLSGIAIIMIIFGGIKYAMALGDENGTEQAKKIMFWSIIGLTIGLLAFYITQLIIDIIT